MIWPNNIYWVPSCAGAVIPRGRLIQCNIVGGRRIAVSDYAFGDSIISNVSISTSGGAIPDESISINYGSIIWRYHCYNHFNPTEFLATSVREWSIIKADAAKLSQGENAQDNAYNALTNIAPKVDAATTAPSQGGSANEYFAFDSITPGPTIGFTAARPVFHPEKKENN